QVAPPRSDLQNELVTVPQELHLLLRSKGQVERQHVATVLAAHAIRSAAVVEARRILVREERSPELPQHLEPDHLAIEERHGPDRHGRERFLDERLIAALRLLPGLEIRARTLRQHAVAYDKVGRIAEEVEIGKGALRLLDDHLLEVEDEPHRALLFVG